MDAKRIISIGAQSERPFYAARMLCKRAGVTPDNPVSETAQLFTRHVLPPYNMCKQGEYDLSMDSIVELSKRLFTHEVPSVERDLRYLQAYYRSLE